MFYFLFIQSKKFGETTLKLLTYDLKVDNIMFDGRDIFDFTTVLYIKPVIPRKLNITEYLSKKMINKGSTITIILVVDESSYSAPGNFLN